jgi:hypothetical protein
MDALQPPARDYVPRRSGELAAPHMEAYAFFRHNTSDAESACFVPGNVTFDAGEVPRVTFKSKEWKSGYLLPFRRRRAIVRSFPSCCFFAGTQAPLHFRLQVLAQALRDDPGSRQFSQVGNRKLRKIGKN